MLEISQNTKFLYWFKMSDKIDTQSNKITPPPGTAAAEANMTRDFMGFRDTITTNFPNARPGESMRSMKWYGNEGKYHRQRW